MNYYRIGKILNTHGLKGDLKIMVVSDFERFNVKDKVYLYYKDEYIPLVVKKERIIHLIFLFALKDLRILILLKSIKDMNYLLVKMNNNHLMMVNIIFTN